MVVDVLGYFLVEDFLNLDLIKGLREGFLLMDSEDGFFEGGFRNVESDFFEFGPLLFISGLVEVKIVLFDCIG